MLIQFVVIKKCHLKTRSHDVTLILLKEKNHLEMRHYHYAASIFAHCPGFSRLTERESGAVTKTGAGH